MITAGEGRSIGADNSKGETLIAEGYRVALAPDEAPELWRERLLRFEALMADAERRHTSHSAWVDVVRLDGASVAIKHYPGRASWRVLGDRRRGTPARRAFDAALYGRAHGIPTPRPLACVEQHTGRQGPRGMLLTEWVEGSVSFRDAIIACLTGGADAPAVMDLLQQVAAAMRVMHDGGMAHRDAGNQNILLRRRPGGGYGAPCFIDLNRARVGRSVSLRQRAFDHSRITLPSDLLRIFQEMYFDGPRPRAFLRWERRYRRRFAWHTATRVLRHPLRTLRQKRGADTGYPAPRDVWLWDPRSAQAMATLQSVDRHRLLCRWDWVRMACWTLCGWPALRREARRLERAAFSRPVTMRGRVGVAISERPECVAVEDACLGELGSAVHVLARFYAHQTPQAWQALAARLQRLHAAGHAITIVLTQDRRSVRDPERWRAFVRTVFELVGAIAETVQVGQAVNRTKWGIWCFREYAIMAAAAAAVACAYPHVKLMGPGVIDFEPHALLGFLRALPNPVSFAGIAHLLYVDRRGAPENRQGRLATLQKLAVLRAVAVLSPHTDDELVVNEVNWPLADTGVWSPVCSPYLYPGQVVPGGVTETLYGYYMLRYLLIALCSGLASRVCWWRLCAHGFGLVDDQAPGGPLKRPAYAMLRVFLQRMEQAIFTGRPQTSRGVHAYRFAAPTGDFTIAYAEAGVADRSLGLPCSRVEDVLGRPLEAYDGLAPEDGALIYLYESVGGAGT